MRSPPMVLVLFVLLLTPPIEATKSSKKASKKEMKMGIKDEKVLHAMESNLLSLFGLQRRPRPNKGDIVIPQPLLDLYKSQINMDIDTTNLALPGRNTASANTVRTFTHQESAIDDQFQKGNRFRLSFEVNSISSSERLQMSELHLRAETDAHILVHDILRPGVRGKQSPIFRVIDSRRVKTPHNQTSSRLVKLDVTPAVQRWLHDPSNNHGLLITVHDPSEEKTFSSPRTRVRLKRNVSPGEWRKLQPRLYTYTDDGKQRKLTDLAMRPRRAARKNKKKGARDNCRRHEMYVSFEAVGWSDWIVAPGGYNGYYCAGECPFPLSDHMNSTNHAIVQTLINDAFPNSAPKACCVPTSLSPTTMLYVDQNNLVVLKNYEDMIIIGCGCR